MKIWRGAAGVESCCRHTLQPTLLLLPNTCIRFLHSLAHTYVCVHAHTHKGCICPHTRTQTHATDLCLADACTNMDTCTTCTPLSCWAQGPNPFAKAHACTHTDTQKEKQISFHCVFLQAPASPNSANPICYNNCHTGTLECFLFFFTLICKELHSYDKKNIVGSNALLWNQF